jgi:hypothetical protein
MTQSDDPVEASKFKVDGTCVHLTYGKKTNVHGYGWVPLKETVALIESRLFAKYSARLLGYSLVHETGSREEEEYRPSDWTSGGEDPLRSHTHCVGV